MRDSIDFLIRVRTRAAAATFTTTPAVDETQRDILLAQQPSDTDAVVALDFRMVANSALTQAVRYLSTATRM